MAEAVAAFSLASAIISLVDVSTRLAERLREFADKTSDVPKSFRSLADRLPILSRTLQQLAAQAKAQGVADEAANDLSALLKSILADVNMLQRRLDDIIPRQGASRLDRAFKSLKSIVKEDKVEQLVTKIHQSIDVLVLHHTTGNIDKEDRILALLSRLAVQPASEPPPAYVKMSFKSQFIVPYTRDRHFISRKAIFEQIDEQIGERKPVVLCGLGGTGKSQLAIEHCYRFREKHCSSCFVFWIYTGTTESVLQGFINIAQKLRLPGHDDPNVDVCQLVADWLEEEDEDDENPRHCLVVVDNVDSTDILDQPLRGKGASEKKGKSSSSEKTLRDYLPKQHHEDRVLMVTTRSQDVAMALGGDEWVSVSSFSPEEARTLLSSKMSRDEGIGLDESDPATDNLLNKLGHVPLAIAQAAAFIRRNRVSLTHYLQVLEKDDQHLAEHLSTELQDPRRQTGWPNSVFRTWKVSFEIIKGSDPVAAKLLSLASMLDGQQIPRWLLDKMVRDSDAQVATSMGTLFGYALVTQHASSGTVSMHPLVQASVRFWLRQEGQYDFYSGVALEQMAHVFPNLDFVENRKKCQTLIPHAEKVLANCKVKAKKHEASLLHSRARYNLSRFLSTDALKDATRAHRLRVEALGEDAEPTMLSKNLIGRCHSDLGNVQKSFEIHTQVLKARKRVLGKTHADTLTSMNNLALALWQLGKREEAAEMHRQVLDAGQDVDGRGKIDTLISMDNLALVLKDMGKTDEAEEWHRKAVNIGKEALGVQHPDTLLAMNNLALILVEKGEKEEAVEMHRQVLKTREKVLGPDHADTLESAWHLGWTLETTKNYDEAVSLYRRALQGFESFYGPDHHKSKQCRQELEGAEEKLAAEDWPLPEK